MTAEMGFMGKSMSGRFRRQKRKKPIRQDGLFTCLMPGSSLLSHGETPHYHRRYGVSLLSSAWGQVGPPRCRRQANSLCSVRNLLLRTQL